MPQIFHPSANTLAKVSIVGGLMVLIGLGLLSAAFIRAPYMAQVGIAPEQPVAFSHEHHVGGLGLVCRYCHTYVEDSSFATIPATEICMSCHSQVWADSPELAPVRESYESGQPIEWVRVYDLPDYVYFDHSIHVNRGVGCVTCHGRVDQMPLTRKETTLYMEWCLECHRDRASFVRPRQQVFNMEWQPPEDLAALQQQLVKEYHIDVEQFNITDCSICHR
jgi:hypothetical protein